jgi:hypothetical protein
MSGNFLSGLFEMNKHEIYRNNLVDLLNKYFKTNQAEPLEAYLINNSNLPGPRGNLELAGAFANVVQICSANASEALWQLCSKLIDISSNEAPTNDPSEFLPFCGAVAIGALASVQQNRFEESMMILKRLANDSRWRMREAICFAMQRLMQVNSQAAMNELETWISRGTLFELRAVAAIVADPPRLKTEWIAIRSLQFHKQIVERFIQIDERKSEPFRILRQGLGYTISVVVCAAPKQGFEFLRQLIHSGDKELLWVVRENLKKNRLLKNFPQEVAWLTKELGSG